MSVAYAYHEMSEDWLGRSMIAEAEERKCQGQEDIHSINCSPVWSKRNVMMCDDFDIDKVVITILCIQFLK